ncbi:MAG: ATP-binding protein [Candidatus Pacebacteria bacterium]|nr:ATP-binding protein [Candidatus Paceibacterota bacterium]
MNIHLLIHTIAYSFDVLLVLFLIGLIAIKAKPGAAKYTLIMTWVCVIVFVVSHMLGSMVTDSELSRKILMFNLVDIFLPLFSAHSVFALLEKNRSQRKVLVLLYTIAITLVTIFVIKPSLFLVTSVPKLYFPNYYVPGPYYWAMLLFFFLVTAYFLVWMIRVYSASNGIEKNRIKYFFIALFFGYTIGSIDFLLIYDIPVDPLIGFLFVPLSVIPYTYAALQYELMSISVVAKRALIYAVTAAFIGLILSGLNYFNTQIIVYYPGFPDWASSIILACLTAVAVSFIWKKAREADVLKYEFMNVVTHKFRTPLTSIKWITENLRETAPENIKEDLRDIEAANERLVELTSLLSNLSGADDKSYEYIFTRIDVGAVINRCVDEVVKKAHTKNIEVSFKKLPPFFISGDEQKMKFVFQTLMDNALSYTLAGGRISVEVASSGGRLNGKKLSVRINDTGIGIPKDELRYIFTKFYRAVNGRKTDTEGMGIGLYLSKHIIERHRGKISVESAGEGKGTTFAVVLPLVE